MSPAPASLIATLDAAATRVETPCGEGTLVWRRWGRGQPLVLLHGGSGSWKHWVRNIEPLSRTHTVWACDMPGFGDSAEPTPPVDFNTMAAPITSGIRQIIPGDQSFDLVGFSLGSHVGQPVVRDLEARVRRFVLVNGHLVGEFMHTPQSMLERWRTVTDRAERLSIFKRNLEALMFADPNNIDDLALAIYESDLEQARARPGKFLHLRDQTLIGRLRCPIAAIAGSLDPLGKPTPAAQVERLKALQPEARCHIVEGAGHWVAYEAADRFNHTLQQVLA